MAGQHFRESVPRPTACAFPPAEQIADNRRRSHQNCTSITHHASRRHEDLRRHILRSEDLPWKGTLHVHERDINSEYRRPVVHAMRRGGYAVLRGIECWRLLCSVHLYAMVVAHEAGVVDSNRKHCMDTARDRGYAMTKRWRVCDNGR